jgi:hypothetical protein
MTEQQKHATVCVVLGILVFLGIAYAVSSPTKHGKQSRDEAAYYQERDWR